MRHRKEGRKLNRTAAHRKAMLRNLVCSLFLLEPKKEGAPRRVTTTVPKAKEARRVAERAITLGKKATLHARRQALALLANKRAVKTLFEDIAPLFSSRNGGYTRILRLTKTRVGDAAPLCYLELVSEPVAPAGKAAEPVAPKVAEAPQARAEEEQAEETAPETPKGAAKAAQEPAGEQQDEPGDEKKDPPS